MPKITALMHGVGPSSPVGVIAFSSILLIEGEKKVVFDSAHVGRRTYLWSQMEALGLTPRDIDVHVVSHAHWDHVQNIDVFDHAPLLLHRDEIRYARKPHRNDWATPQWTGAILDTIPGLTEVGEGYEVMPGVKVVELPGHSPGSIGLEVETEDGVCMLVGDAIHHAGVALAGRSPLVFWNEQQANASIKRVVDSGAIIYPGHDLPFRIKDGEAIYLDETTVEVSGGPNVQWVEPPSEPAPITTWVMPGIEDQSLSDD
jgi:N-acyl homoserine lactone hydrolase